MTLIERIQHYRKGIVAVIGAVLLVLGDQGVTAAQDIPALVLAVALAAGVVVIPND